MREAERVTRTEESGAGGVDPRELWRRQDRPRRGRRPAFSREAITTAAIALADAEGIDAVTMRRVASEVGAGVMSLYSYAPDKETLLDLMIDQVSGELPTSGPLTGDWRADLKNIGRDQRAHMLRHPWLPAAVQARRTLGPHTLAFLEHALAALRPSGLDGAARLEIFAQLTSFVAAHVAYEVGQARAAQDPGRAAEALYLAEVAADGSHPELAEALAGAAGRPGDPDAMFDRFLTRLVDGLDAG